MKVLVAGVPGNATMAAARGLFEAGHRVDLALSATPRQFLTHRIFFSRHVTRYLRLAAAAEDASAFGAGLLQAVRGGGYDVVLPTTVEQSLVMWDHEPELARYARLALVPRHLIELAHDKRQLFGALHGSGIACPRTYAYAGEEDLLGQVMEYPVVVKPRRSSGSSGMRHARNADELRAALRLLNHHHPRDPRFEDWTEPVVQERIPGLVHDAMALFRHGEPRAILIQRRDSMFPVHGGISVDVTVRRDAALEHHAASVLRHLGWHGVCNVECIRDERDGVFKLLEINPRLWGALDIAIHAGVNFPHKFCEMIVEGDTAAQEYAGDEFRYTVMLPNKLYALVQDRGGRRGQLRSVGEILRGRRTCEIDPRDPLPSLMRLLGAGGRILRHHRRLLHPPRYGGET